MRLFSGVMLGILAAAPALLRADVTIRYQAESSSPGSAGVKSADVIYMKGNKGVTISGNQTTIVDFGRQEVTVIDTVRRKYATVPAADYGKNVADDVASAMPDIAGVGEMLKSAKTACTTKDSAATEKIQGIQAVLHEITCTTTMAMPDAVKAMMPEISMKSAMKIWTAAPSERLRVPGLWQLSGFELWQNYFMNPKGVASDMEPEGAKAMADAMPKDQSATLRVESQMSMKMPMAGAPGVDSPIMTGSREMTGMSTELLEDAVFTVPGDCSREPFKTLMKALMDEAQASVTQETAKARAEDPKTAIPENVKAFIPVLYPLMQTQPILPLDANGDKIQGTMQLLVTVGPKGNVEQAEVLSGPEALRKAAIDTVQKWTYRPVIRDGVPVSAYTEATVSFRDFSKRGASGAAFAFTPDMVTAQERFSQLQTAFHRSPEQEFADIEQDAGGGDKLRREARLGELALKAASLGATDKARAYATELLTGAEDDKKAWNYGNAIHAGHSVLGLVALKNNDVQSAREELLAAGRTPGSPQLNSFGPNMILASELLKRGDRDTVLQYLDLCRKFWKLGGTRLDAMSETVRGGGTPAFNTNMPQ